jgi:hypothetical protein
VSSASWPAMPSLLYVIQPQAVFHSQRDLTRPYVEPLRQFHRFSSAELIVHLPPLAVNHTPPIRLNGQKRVNTNLFLKDQNQQRRFRSSLSNHSEYSLDRANSARDMFWAKHNQHRGGQGLQHYQKSFEWFHITIYVDSPIDI